MKAWHGVTPSRFARTPRATHVDENDRDEKRRAERAAVAGAPAEIHISVVPHASLALLLSIVTIALGVAIFLVLDRARDAISAALR